MTATPRPSGDSAEVYVGPTSCIRGEEELIMETTLEQGEARAFNPDARGFDSLLQSQQEKI